MSDLELVPLSNALGAEVRGIDISRELSGAQVAAIRKAWNAHHILLFRGLDLTPEQHIAFSRRFGDLDTHDATPFDRLDGHPEILEVTNKPKNGKPSETRNTGRNWHSDYAYTSRPSAGSMLYCAEKPPVGGDTIFCNMVRAYDELSPKMKEIVEGLHAVFDFALVGRQNSEKTQELRKLNPPIAHPAVRIHPDSGLKALYVSERASHFHGLTPEESRPSSSISAATPHATRTSTATSGRWATCSCGTTAPPCILRSPTSTSRSRAACSARRCSASRPASSCPWPARRPEPAHCSLRSRTPSGN